MKIALYCPNKPLNHPNPSGDLVIAAELRKALTLFGHECEEVARFRSRWFWRSPAGWAGALGAFPRALKAARRFSPHVWITYHSYYKSPDVLGPLASRLLRIPYVLFQPMFGTRRRKDVTTRTGYYLNRIALKSARHAFVNNLDDMEAIRRIVPFERITYLPPGILPGFFQRNEEEGLRIRRDLKIPVDSPLLMTAARFRDDVKFRSLEYLFRSLRLLQTRIFDFRVIVAGDGPMEGRLREIAEELVPGRAIFVGRVARNAMKNYYSAADLFVFPGIGESLGMVFLEAQSCGLPVVALDTAGVPQVVRHGETGLLVPQDSGEAMAAAIEELLKDGEARARMGSSGTKFVARERNLEKNYIELCSVLDAIVRRN